MGEIIHIRENKEIIFPTLHLLLMTVMGEKENLFIKRIGRQLCGVFYVTVPLPSGSSQS